MLIVKSKEWEVIVDIINKAVIDLIPYINNARTHSTEQVTQIAASIKEFGFCNPVLIDGNNGIIAGHGRVMAAQKLGMESVPTIELSHLNDTQRKAYILADNRLAELSGWDDGLLKLELSELQGLDFDLSLIGFDDFDFAIDDDNGAGSGNGDEKYTMKTDVFTYEPTGEQPEISELYKNDKTNELLHQIEKADIPEDIKLFLRLGAHRHIVFDFGKIANYYAHSNIEIQQLMENSAMIIIDYNDAISGGFVQLTKELQALVADND